MFEKNNNLPLIPPQPEHQKTCAIIVTFHPDNNFPLRLTRIIPQVGKVIIVDNTPSGLSKDFLNRISSEKVAIIINKENLGIAAALNQGAHWAIDHLFTWAVLFDQDTFVEEEFLESLIKTYALANDPQVAIIGANYHAEGFKKRTFRPQKREWIRQRVVITSGSLISLSIYTEVGGFRDEFFIDAVDHEFCIKCSKRGYKIIASLITTMSHDVGAAKYYHFFGLPWLKLIYINHPPFRKYFMLRNLVIICSEYFSYSPFWVIKLCWDYFVLVMKGLLFDTDRRTQIKYILLGIQDGIHKKTDRKIAP